MRTTLFSAALFLTVTGCKDAKPAPRPFTDVVSIPAGEFLGRVSTCADVRTRESSVLSEPNADRDVRQRIEGFEIERYPNTCEDWLQCKRAGVCRISGVCDPGDKSRPPAKYAVLKFEEAQRLCTWRGGRLPTLPEIQRAIRGTSGATYPPGWNEESRRILCPRPGELGQGYYRSCEQTSPDGVVYFTEASSELTSTMSCGSDGRAEPGHAMMMIDFDHLASVLSAQEVDTFGFVRCVRTHATGGADRR